MFESKLELLKTENQEETVKYPASPTHVHPLVYNVVEKNMVGQPSLCTHNLKRRRANTNITFSA
jgi:hypothetical protein